MRTWARPMLLGRAVAPSPRLSRTRESGDRPCGRSECASGREGRRPAGARGRTGFVASTSACQPSPCLARSPRAQRLPVPVHREIVQVEDARVAAVAAALVEVGLHRRLGMGSGSGGRLAWRHAGFRRSVAAPCASTVTPAADAGFALPTIARHETRRRPNDEEDPVRPRARRRVAHGRCPGGDAEGAPLLAADGHAADQDPAAVLRQDRRRLEQPHEVPGVPGHAARRHAAPAHRPGARRRGGHRVHAARLHGRPLPDHGGVRAALHEPRRGIRVARARGTSTRSTAPRSSPASSR